MRISALAGFALLAGFIPVDASFAGPAILDLAQRLDDDELAEMHGKFVSPDAVSFFGITMLTSWQDESGVTTLARLVFNVDFLNASNGGQPVPQVMIAWSREGDPSMDVTGTHDGYVPYISPEQVLPIGGLDSFHGAAQANVIAGADNRALNGLQMMIVPASALPALADGGLQPTAGSTSHAFADGDELLFRIADNQIGLVMTGNGGLDTSTQVVGGDMGQLLQQTILNSDRNIVSNTTSIIFGIDQLNSLNIVRAEEAMSAMKGHGY